jgi:hypothetical protein
MTIAKRLVLLLAVPLLALAGLGGFTRLQLTTIENRSRFVSDLQIPSLATLGHISRTFAELRVDVRNHVLATSDAERVSVRSAFARDEAALDRLLDQYESNLISNGEDRRLLNDYRNRYREWLDPVHEVMALSAAGRRDEANELLRGVAQDKGERLGHASVEWIPAQRRPRAVHESDCRGLHYFRALADPGRERRGHPVDRPAGVSHLSADRKADSGPRRLCQSDCLGGIRQGGPIHGRHR